MVEVKFERSARSMPKPLEMARIPESFWVYYLLNQDDEVLYIGVSYNVPARLRQHKADKPWFPQVAFIATERYAYDDLAFAAEVRAIRRYEPPYNVKSTPAHNAVISDRFKAMHAPKRAERACVDASEDARA